MGQDGDSSSDGFEDPEPVCPPPIWAAHLIADARSRAGSEVYPPSDDTFLLLEALAADARHLRALRPSLCLEVGCGSGAVSAGLLEVLRGESEVVDAGDKIPFSALLAIDKNPTAAARSAALLWDRGSVFADVVRGSLLSGLRITGLVDVLVCNPPYVPTDAGEMLGCGIEVSWAGGSRGREVIDVLLPQVSKVLVPGGLFYLVCMAENEPDDIMDVMRSFGLHASVAKREQRGIEDLSILRFQRPGGPCEAMVRVS